MSERFTTRGPAIGAAPSAGGAARLFAGPGEMRALCRALDWSATPLGPVTGWSHSLRTVAGLVLDSRTPMFLFWGPELVQLYNDAFRPSLAARGRHPRALGTGGREVWTDLWDAIGPRIEQVMTRGEAARHEDQHLPIERDGRLEDAWWTYGYSPVRDDDGRIGGTLVVCHETTPRVLAERERARLRAETAHAERRAARILAQVSDAHLAMDDAFRIVYANPAAERLLGLPRERLLGRTHWEVFPSSVGSVAERHYRRVMAERVEAHFAQHYAGEGYDVHVEVDAYPTDDGGIVLFWRDVTERRRVEMDNARLAAVVQASGEAVLGVTPEGIVESWNPAAERLFGYSAEEMVGRSIERLAPPERRGEQQEVLAALHEGRTVRHETVRVAKSGRPLHVLVTTAPITDGRGQLVGVSATAVDVSERVRSEAARHESEARYRTLFDSIDEGLCVVEVLFDDEGRATDYRFLEANPAFARQTGLDDAVGRRAREAVPELEAHWYEAYGHVATTGEAMRFESGSDAMHRWFDVYAFRIGRPADHHVAILFKDVSARRAAARERDRLVAALELERARLAYVFQQAPAFLAVLRGPRHVFTLVNDAYYQLVGHRELLGREAFEALPEVADQGFGELLDGVLATGQPFVGREVPLRVSRTPDAPPEERFVDLAYLPLVEADGARTGIIAHGTDVTAQVLARREVERLLGESERARADAEAARAEAEAANRSKAEFLAVMSHELRTPLNAIGGYAELMEMGIRGPVTEPQRHDLARIRQSQRHLLGLINEVLNYAKLETGTVHYDLTAVCVRDALAAAESLVSPQARGKRLALAVRACPDDLHVRADAEKLRQVLVNLLSNAVKFTDAGRIEVSAAADGASVLVEVRDTGIGIPADKHAAIFEPFVQVRADLARTADGTGLGLAISRDLARGMGGDLTVRSEVGVGSTFTLALPRA